MDKLGEIDVQKQYIEKFEIEINEKKIKLIPKKRIELEPQKLDNDQKATI